MNQQVSVITEKIESIKDYIVKTIILILKKTEEVGFSLDLERPLIEMGLDSEDLLELNLRIYSEYKIQIEPSRNTGALIISYLQEQVGLKEEKRRTLQKLKKLMTQDKLFKKCIVKKNDKEFGTHNSSIERQEIAIIGMACRFPGSRNYEEFWENIKRGQSDIQEIPPERWDWKEYWGDPQTEKNKSNCKWGGYIKDVDTFDPSFFSLSPREVEAMDPQQRIMLELSWSCFEDAGICPSYVSGEKIGVYIGVFNFDYKELQEKQSRTIETYHSTGTAAAVIANRISHYFNLKGPSIPLDTACSSSLNSVHLAMQSLQLGECTMAIAGGISLLLTPTRHISFAKTGMLSPTGSCKTFDEDADGYVRGEGAGLILLKPLKKAIEDGDSIYGVLKGSAVNHNGKTHTLTYPNPEAQAEVIIDAYKRAGITPESISYIEAHGTGTPKGDPMEFQGLLRAFQYGGQKLNKNYCGLGSVKTNIGHLESAAGIAGVIKVLLSMKYKQLPGLQNFKQLNHRIPIQNSPFYIIDQLQDWKPLKGENDQVIPRRAGVSSFGFGGTNAHVILEEAPVITKPDSKELPSYLICLSAKTEEALRQREKDLALWLEKEGQKNNLADISAILLLGREHFGIRSAYVVGEVLEFQEKLKEVLEKGQVEGYFRKIGAKKGKERQPLIEQLGRMILNEMQSDEKFSEHEYRNKVMTLAEMYVNGYDLDVKVIFPDLKRRRISIPTYPFAKERYWIPELDISEKPSQISLGSLSDDQLISSETVDQTSQSIKLPSTNIGISQSVAIESSIASQPCTSIESLQKELKTSLAEALYMKRNDIDVDENFIDIGLDSIIGVEWIRAINKQYGTSLLATTVYDYPNISELAKLLEKQFNIQSTRLAEINPSDVNLNCQSELQSSNHRHCLSSIPEVGSTYTNISEKPSQISLGSLSDDQIISSETVCENLELFTLPTENTCILQPEANQSSIASPGISTESLQEELKTSLAEALYMKRNDIDVDDNFIDIGLDSIIGVEWIRAINKQYGTSLLATIVYDFPNINELARFLEKQFNDQSKKAVEINHENANKEFTRIKPLPEQSPNYSPKLNKKWCSLARSSSRFRNNHNIDKLNPTNEGLNQNIRCVGEEYRSEKPDYKETIAIVGMSGRYPGASELGKYWDNIVGAKNSIREIPNYRWDVNQYYDLRPSQKGKVYCKWIGLLDDIEYFDPLFFNISPTEAELMDPQHRIFLQEGYKAFEDAGYSRQLLSNKKCGVYLGIMSNEYGEILYRNQAGMADITGNNYAIAAARLPYFLNLKGPAIAIDTACSSSLVATHLACQALLHKEIDMALAGGVSLYLTPEMYIGMCAAGMLSPEGQCKTFDNSADGFVPGEGVGALVLKRLKDAEADNDFIYGVIIGSDINQDGKTNGITAPSMNSQIELEREIYHKNKIHPESISYVEMHGTGTKLGDPIELEALSTVFKERTNQTKYCAIGSVKSNIGHTSAAAGVASIQKVLLCLKHKKLVPTLNFKEHNEHYNFNDSPFYVNTESRSWEVASGNPRRAGVSAFGFSGTNAHLVIEEYLPKTNPERTPMIIDSNHPILFTLSAKSKEQLTTYAESMKNFMELHVELNLVDMAYTLQVGREAMDYRLAFLADSRNALLKALEGFIHNNSSTEVLTAQVKKSKDGVVIFEADEDAKELLQTWIQKGKLKKVSELWVKGLNIDWNKLYGELEPCRISLPTYPFARERYWMPESEVQFADGNTAATSVLAVSIHPLLHQNTSNIYGLQFSSTFTGQEFFITDHVIKGRRVLPGVACLEMARAALEQAVGTLEKEQAGIRLKNVIWARPIYIEDQAVQVHIGLYPEDNGEIAYEIYSKSEAVDAELIVHSHGSAVQCSLNKANTLNLKALQTEFNQNSLSSSQCYEVFRAMGIDYGPGHQGIDMVYVGTDQILAKLSLPSSVLDTQKQFVLHPSLLDSALQASIGLTMSSGDLIRSGSVVSLKPSLPFALHEIEIFGSCTPSMWALVRYSDGSKAGDKVEKFDIDLCDEQGNICVRMKGFSTRVLEEVRTDNIPNDTFTEPLVGTIMLTPVWDSIPVEKGQTFPTYTDQVVIVGGNEANKSDIKQYYPKARLLDINSKDNVEEIARKFKAHGYIDHIVWIAPNNSLGSLTDDALIEEQNQGVLQVFKMIKALLHLEYGTKYLGWSLITLQSQPVHKNDSVNPTHASLYGLTGSMAKEYPNWKIRLIDMEDDCDWPISDIFTLPPDSQGNAWVYRSPEWYRQTLIPVHRPQLEQTLYKSGGVYVVIGGAGGIGEAWSEYMIRTYQAQICWIGRRQKDTTIQAKLDKLAALGPTPYYISADAADQKALQRAYEEIKERYLQIHGVIHSAIVLLDKSLENMEEERFQAGLAAKVEVSVHMAQVFQREPLDFVMFFSSIISFTKAPGQSNYASGCTFMDAFAHQLSREWPCAVKVMNWGYWGSIGIVASKAYQDRMAQDGIGSIEPPEGMEALETLLSGSMDQVAFMKTIRPVEAN